MKMDKVREYYDSFLASEPGKYSSLAEFSARYGPIESFFKDKKDLKILDVGCGTGMAAERLRKFGKVHGIDISPKSIEMAKERLDSAVVGIAEDIKYPDGTFDAVVCTETVEHVLDQSLAISEFRRVLKEDGHLLISTPNPWYWLIVLSGIYSKIRGRTNTGQIIENYLSPLRLRKLVARNGFSIEHHRTVYFKPEFVRWVYPMGLYQICIARRV